MGNQMLATEIREWFHARFAQTQIISRAFRRGKLFDFGENASEIILYKRAARAARYIFFFSIFWRSFPVSLPDDNVKFPLGGSNKDDAKEQRRG